MLKLLELLTVFFGLFCVVISIILGFRFHKVRHSLSKALALQLVAEGVIGAVTVIFSLTSLFELYETLTPHTVLILRLIIFGLASSTSVNLYIKVKELERRNDDR